MTRSAAASGPAGGGQLRRLYTLSHIQGWGLRDALRLDSSRIRSIGGQRRGPLL